MTLTNEELAQLEEETAELRQRHSFESYCINLRYAPNDTHYEAYLLELRDMLGSPLLNQKQVQLITPEEVEAIHARKIWTEVVSETYAMNERIIIHQDIKSKILENIKNKGYQDPETVYVDCLRYLADASVITVTFNAHFLSMQGGSLNQFELLNYYQSHNLFASREYEARRDKAEKAIFDFCSQDLKQSFTNNELARPRYGAIRFIDEEMGAELAYGSSFLVLKNVVKLNAILSPQDSLNAFLDKNNPRILTMATFHHPELILYQLNDRQFNALLSHVRGQALSNNSLNSSGIYIEVMLPPINLMDPNLIEHIYFAKEEHVPTKEEIKTLEERGIHYTVMSKPTYRVENKHLELNKLIENHDLEGFKAAYHEGLAHTVNREAFFSSIFKQALNHHAKNIIYWLVKNKALSLHASDKAPTQNSINNLNK